jgi:hypothetical protein
VQGRGKSRTVIFGFVLSLFLLSCKFSSSYSNDPIEIIIKGDHFSLAWDDDSLLIHDNPEKPRVYRVYYRTHSWGGGAPWKVLRELPAGIGTTKLKITKDNLGYGLYDFGVTALDVSGAESEIHTSLDMTADPICGWYISWIESK